VTCDYSPLVVDTITVLPTNVMPGEFGSTAITAKLNNEVARLNLPLRFDTSVVMIDSLQFAPGLPLFMDKFYRIDRAAGTVNLTLNCAAADTGMVPGTYTIAEFFLTGGDTAGITTVDTVNTDSLFPLVVTRDTVEKTPVVIPGDIRVGNPTSVDPGNGSGLPEGYALFQNYPNPFNAGTVIEFELPVAAEIRLEIFDILGRRVARPANGRFRAGLHRVYWSGRADNGAEVTSGVYLYRLVTDSGSSTSKMLLLK